MLLVKDKLSRTLLSIGGFALTLFFLSLLFQVVPWRSTQNNSALIAESIPLPEPSIILPLHLKIPALALDTAIEYVGLTKDGSMQAPSKAVNVAWFDLGPRPGEAGNAVIAGHYGYEKGKPAAFDQLYKLRKGDKVYVENSDGTTVSFVVRATRRYDPNADASAVFGSTDGNAHLNLVTCEGDWDTVLNGYPARLVVFTDKE